MGFPRVLSTGLYRLAPEYGAHQRPDRQGSGAKQPGRFDKGADGGPAPGHHRDDEPPERRQLPCICAAVHPLLREHRRHAPGVSIRRRHPPGGDRAMRIRLAHRLGRLSRGRAFDMKKPRLHYAPC